MRETNTIAAEIVELSEIKSAYNYFLASHDGQLDVENATYIRKNKAIVSENLKKLYVELANSQKAKATSEEADSRLQDSDSSRQIAEISNNKTQPSNDKHQTQNPQRETRNPLPDTHNLRMKFEPYHATELEERAILLFYSDRRYSITE